MEPGHDMLAPELPAVAPGHDVSAPQPPVMAPGDDHEVSSPQTQAMMPSHDMPAGVPPAMAPGHDVPAPNPPAMAPGHDVPQPPMGSPGDDIPAPQPPAMAPGHDVPTPQPPAISPGHDVPAPQRPVLAPGHNHNVPATQPPVMVPSHDVQAPQQPAMVPSQQPWEYSLRKYLLLLATVVASVTYAAGFNPPGGVWQEGANDHGQLAGDPILRNTHYDLYLTFFYWNSTAFGTSLTIILILAVQHDKVVWVASKVRLLRVFMLLGVLSLMGAYGVGTCRDKVSTVYSAVLVTAVFLYISVLKLLDWWFPDNNSDSSSNSSGVMPAPNADSGTMLVPDSGSRGVMPATNLSHGSGAMHGPFNNSDSGSMPEDGEKEALKKLKAEERLRKVLMLLATFTVSITYVAGLSTPGGFWDSTGASHRPGDAILKDHHNLRLTMFLLCNTTSFVASLLITMLLIIDRKLREKTARSLVLYGCIVVALVGLVVAYTFGSCRKIDTTIYVGSLVAVVLAYIILHASFYSLASSSTMCSCPSLFPSFSAWLATFWQPGDNDSAREALDKARSLVLLLATLATTITYSAGLNPPGGLWLDNNNLHIAGSPILLTTNSGRYWVFYYCNSVAFVASLVSIVLVQKELLVKHRVLEVAMILNLLGLIGAYATGSSRDVITSISLMAFAGAILAYVVIHVAVFTQDHTVNKDDHEDQLLEKKRKRLLLFAILAATITYQAGLNPPGGFLLQEDDHGRHVGIPLLLYHYPRRYNGFFYFNSVSFILSIALIIILVIPNMYRPAIRSHVLSVFAAVGLICLMEAYATGSTQHIKTSIYTFLLVAVVLFVAAGLLIVFMVTKIKRNGSSAAVPPIEQDEEEREKEEEERNEDEEERKKHARRKYLMLVAILVASVTYQAGLQPPGGAWQSSSDVHEAGVPVMHDNMRGRYLTFFYCNSISFVASIVVIIMLLPRWLPKKNGEEWEGWPLKVMNRAIILDLVALLFAYAAGSCRGWKTSMYVVALILAVLSYFVIHMILALCCDRRRQSSQENPPCDSISVSSVV